ncbi:MAG: cell division protein FtsW [Bacteroidetes bacterium]|nr:cell division protein FtsW [Bacteroidota bacterium]
MLKIRRNHIDIWLLIVVLGLMVVSLGVVYSASAEWSLKRFETQNHYIDLHAIKVLLSISALFVGLSIPYSFYKKFTKFTLIAAVLFLTFTFLLGGETKGAVRWLRFGGLGFQPSEFAKFALLFHISYLLTSKGEYIKDFKKGFLPIVFWIAIVTGLVLAQPNLSTSVMLLVLTIVLMYVGRVRILHLLSMVLASAGLFTLYILFMAYVLKRPYQLQRIINFVQGDSGGYNYQLWQGIIGFGNGGLFGVGPGESRQRDLFLPEAYNDFIYSIVGEEYGLLGTVVVLGAFLFIMLRGFRIAKYAKDEFARFLAVAITSTIILYALVNASVALGIFPTTGLPMPFISYGGSSLMLSAFSIGVLLNISAHTDLHPRITKITENDVAALAPETGVRKTY